MSHSLDGSHGKGECGGGDTDGMEKIGSLFRSSRQEIDRPEAEAQEERS